MKQFFEAGSHLRGSWNKSSSIAIKLGYPRGLGGSKNGPEMIKIPKTEKMKKKMKEIEK